MEVRALMQGFWTRWRKEYLHTPPINLNLRDSAKLVIREVIIFWEKARIPVREEYHLLKKVESLYNEWRNLQKHSTRKSAKDRKNEEIFVNKLNDIFDIAHARALDIMKIECDKQLLKGLKEDPVVCWE
ncbi:hypothetical protein QTP88_006876 [Uroleucon formosanum]